jgi:hypothetical protein
MASYVFSAKTIPMPPLSDAKIRAQVLNALKDTSKDINQRFSQITSTWKHKPKFARPIIRYAGGDAYIIMGTSDDIFRWLDEGTSVRWSKLSRDWISKTTPNVYQSGPGRGYVWLRGKNAIIGDPQAFIERPSLWIPPGIQARNWTLMLERDSSIVLSFRMDAALGVLAKII